MYKLQFIISLGNLFLLTAAFAGPNDPVALGLQLAQIDYDAIHSVLVERCRSNAPNSVEALAAAIASWKSKNDPALQQLRFLSKNSLIKRFALSESEASLQVVRLSDFLTSGAKSRFEQVSVQELKVACDGQYASQSLDSPTLDFNALLEKVQPGNVHH